MRIWQVLAITKFSEQREAQSSFFAIAYLFGRAIALLALMYAVFNYGLRASLPNGRPYFEYFAPGYIAWTLFADSVLSAFSFVKANKFIAENSPIRTNEILLALLVKNLKVHVLLVASYTVAASAVFELPTVHLFDLATAIALNLSIVYIACAISLMVGIVATRSDFFMPVIINMLFWATPIAWTPEVLPERFAKYFSANPLYIIADMYRNAANGEQNANGLWTCTIVLLSFCLAFGVYKAIGHLHRRLIDGLK